MNTTNLTINDLILVVFYGCFFALFAYDFLHVALNFIVKNLKSIFRK